MSVVGFDDIGHLTKPPLTTVRVDLTEVGRLAGAALLRRIQGATSAYEKITVPVELIVRGSTAPPPSEK